MSGKIIKTAGAQMKITTKKSNLIATGPKGIKVSSATQINTHAETVKQYHDYSPLEIQPNNTNYVHLGVFYDGTGNNMYNTKTKILDPENKKLTMSYDANYGNVARLFCRYKNKPEIINTPTIKKNTYYDPLYVEGIGTSQNKNGHR